MSVLINYRSYKLSVLRQGKRVWARFFEERKGKLVFEISGADFNELVAKVADEFEHMAAKQIITDVQIERLDRGIAVSHMIVSARLVPMDEGRNLVVFLPDITATV